MMSYEISILPSVEKQIKKLPKPVRIRIADNISALAYDPRPHGSKKLKGRQAYRIRIGNYRVVYEIKDSELKIIILAAGDRKDIYR